MGGMVVTMLGQVVWGTTWAVGALWGAVIGGGMWIYRRSNWYRGRAIPEISEPDDAK